MSMLNVKVHARAHIRLSTQSEVMAFVMALTKFEDHFSIENKNGNHRVNAKSVIGVMYTMMDFPEELFLVNDTNDGVFPGFVDGYRALMSESDN